MSISLKEMTSLVEEKSVEELMEDEGVMEFVREMDNSGTFIFNRSLGDDEKCASTMISLIQAIVSVQLLNDGDMKTLMMMLANPKAFATIVAISVKMGVGLAAMEEWH